MRFFTKELWIGAQGDATGSNKRKWSAALKRYFVQLEKLRPRLAAEAFDFFASADVHDGELMSFTIIDGSRPAPLDQPSRPWNNGTPHPVRAELVVLDANERLLWTVQYRSIRRLIVDFPSDEPLFPIRGEGFSDWGYHELTGADAQFLRHEVLFASGATVLVEFGSVEVLSVAGRSTQ